MFYVLCFTLFTAVQDTEILQICVKKVAYFRNTNFERAARANFLWFITFLIYIIQLIFIVLLGGTIYNLH